MKLFKRSTHVKHAQKLTPVVFRDLGGGWNTLDDDVNMSMRYMPVLTNFHRTSAGAQELRYGTRWVADVADTVDGDIVDMEYFNGRIVAVTDAGEIATIDADGVKTAIWNNAIAALLVGSPDGWNATFDTVDFVFHRDRLIIHNGVDKPVSIDHDHVVTYLADEPTGSNINVPIGRFGAVALNYHCIAGIPDLPTTVYISAVGTSGTFPGDPDPNDAISIDVGAYAPDGANEIIGLAGFRTWLLVFFPGQTLVVTLGIYDADETHTPQFPDSLPQFGLLSHRCIINVQNDLIFSDQNGVNSAARNLISSQLDSSALSDLVSPDYKADMGALSIAEASTQVFAVHDKLRSETLVFAPERVFVYSFSKKLKYSSWSDFTGWSFTSACASFLGRVYFSEGTRIYQLGNKAYSEEYFADKTYDRDSDWATATVYRVGDMVYDSVTDKVYTAAVIHVSNATFAEDLASEYWIEYLGEPISFDLELPWLDGREPMRLKHMRYVSIISRGTAHFDLSLYVDNLYKDVNGAEIHDAAITLTMAGNDYRGAGFSVNMGGARRSGDPRLWKFPAKFKSCKFRITGEATEPLTIIGLSFLHARGQFKRG